MLKTVIIAVSGRDDENRIYYPNGRGFLTNDGLSDTHHLARQIKENGYSPSVIFTSTTPASLGSAYMLAGALPSVKAVAAHDMFRFGFEHHYRKRDRLKSQFREHLSSSVRATDFFLKLCPFADSVSEVVFISGECWGTDFGRGAGQWPRGAGYAFSLASQESKMIGRANPEAHI